MRTSWVDQILRGLGKVMGSFLVEKLLSKMSRFSTSFLKSNCWFIMDPKTWTSSGSEIHFIPGRIEIAWAKNRIMETSRAMVLDTRGWRTLMATDAVGTEGGGFLRIAGARAPPRVFGLRRGPRYDGGMRSFLRVARYTYRSVRFRVRKDDVRVHPPAR